MHLLATTSTTLDEIVEPVDLRQPPGDMVVLSFADTDLSALAAAWAMERDALPSVRLAHLRDLRHPMSVDLWIDAVAVHAKVIVVRLLGGLDWWRYGVERLGALARERAIALALLPGEDRDDARLAEASTLPPRELDALLRYFREGGCENLRALLRRLARHAGADVDAPEPRPVPRMAAYLPGRGAISVDALVGAIAELSLPEGEGGRPPTWSGGGRVGSSETRRSRDSAHFTPPDRLTSFGGHPPHPNSGLPEFGTLRWPKSDKSDLGWGGIGAPPVVAIIFYRALLLAADTAAVDALSAALAARGLAPAPLVVTNFKEAGHAQFIRAALARLSPAVVVTTTAFAIGGEPGEATLLDEPDVPVIQVVLATTRRAAWRESPRGLGAADLAMHVVLPELDGRVLAGAVSFKEALSPQDGLAFTTLANRPEGDRIAMVADRIAALVRLRASPRAERRVAVLMPHYAGAPGREGYAVGLDVPASVLALLADLRDAGYDVSAVPQNSRALIDSLDAGTSEAALSLDAYARLLTELPGDAVARVNAAWGEAAADPDLRDGAFRFRARAFGSIVVALPPDRGRSSDRRADYHDLTLPPRHALVAFGLWLQRAIGAHAVVHMGAHGTLEWLPGKAVALTSSCFPEIVTGALPVIYPFIVSNPGEAAAAKRRIAAVTIGHLPPPLGTAPLSGEARELERLVDEFAQADGLDRRRRERLARLIIDTAQRSGIAREAGLAGELAPDDALRRIDAWLCDLKDLAIKDGLHVYGRSTVHADGGMADGNTAHAAVGAGPGSPKTLCVFGVPRKPAPTDGEDGTRVDCAHAERAALLGALDGRRVPPGPAGSPARGRRDVLPTGRNLFTADPRMLPTPTAVELGRLAADEVIRTYLQTHGEMPRALVIDLWGSATLRTGGEEIAQGLTLMGCRPTWDHATGRVTGIEVLPIAAVGRARVDVTWRVSGLFRDLFPAQIALIDAAVRTVAARVENDEDNPLAAALRVVGARHASPLQRIFGAAPGAYGAGVDDMLGRESDRDALGAAYLAAASHAYGGADGGGRSAPGAFAARVGEADLLVHPGDDPGRDLLEGAEDAAFVGGFAAAAAMLGRAPDLIMLDLTDPQRPRARALGAALSRIVRGRAVNPRFIAGLMRHGARGAAELAETVDRLVAFAETTGQVPGALLDLVHAAYVGDPAVRDFLLRENRAAARVIAERLEAALRNGLWHPCRNDVGIDLAAFAAQVAQ
jgi:cobaltochelatase CobN